MQKMMAPGHSTAHRQTPEYRRSRGPRGQRQLVRRPMERPAPVWVDGPVGKLAERLLVLPCALLTALLVAQPAENPLATVELPAHPLSVAEADGWIVASLGLSGVAFIPQPPWPEEPPVIVRSDWPSLSLFDLEGPRFLLAGRDGMVRHVVIDSDESEPRLLLEFPVEGVPNQVALDGGTLIVAAGGAGVTLWDWPELSRPPELRGRYPFVEFARWLAVDPLADRLYVADSIGGRVAVLDIEDPMRPHLVESYPVASFCDSLQVDERFLLFTDRNAATFVARRAPDNGSGNLWLLHQQIGLINPQQEHRDVKRVMLLSQEESFLICEGESGVRQWSWDEDAKVFREMAGYRPRGSAVDAAVLTTGHLVVADHPHGLSLFRLVGIPERR